MPAGDVGTAFGNAELDPPGEPDGDEGGYVGNGEGVSSEVLSISQPVVDPCQEPAKSCLAAFRQRRDLWHAAGLCQTNANQVEIVISGCP